MGDWWTPLIIRDLYFGINRFDALIEDLGMSRNLLAARLKHLTEEGLIARQSDGGRITYALTKAGEELVPILAALTAWGDKWATPPDGTPLLFGHEGCCEVMTPTVCCGECRQPLTAQNVMPQPGPGAKTAPGTQILAQLGEADAQ
ncbi:winged helix-turn-helix transcriptional regulator [Paracoccaceae bacterium GXU_MW_L88]